MHSYKTIIDDIALENFYKKPLRILHVDKAHSLNADLNAFMKGEGGAEYDAIRFLKRDYPQAVLANWNYVLNVFNDLRNEIMRLDIESGNPYHVHQTGSVVISLESVDGFYHVDLNNCHSVYSVKLDQIKSQNVASVQCRYCGKKTNVNKLSPISVSKCDDCLNSHPYFDSFDEEAARTKGEAFVRKLKEGAQLRKQLRNETPYIYFVKEELGAIPKFLLEFDNI